MFAVSTAKTLDRVGGRLPLPCGYQRVVGRPSAVKWGISKAAKGRFPVIEAADRSASKIERAFLVLVDSVKERIVLKDLAEKLAQGDLTGAEQLVDVETAMEEAALGKGIPVGERSLQGALQEAFNAGALAEEATLADVMVEKAAKKKPRIGVELSLNLLNPEAVAFLQGYTLNLIRQVSLGTRLAIRDVILNAFIEGGHPYEQARVIRGILGPYEQARTIKDMVGLTTNQTNAVRRFRMALLSGDSKLMKEALTKALRDHRFDPTIRRAIQTQTTIPKAKADVMVQRYYQRYLAYRARNIARTESIRASSAGQQEVWRQALEQGLLNPEKTRRHWIITPDDRLCEFCRGIRELNPDGVRLDEEFITDGGSVDQPPAHPSCRCAVGLRILRKTKYPWGTKAGA